MTNTKRQTLEYWLGKLESVLPIILLLVIWITVDLAGELNTVLFPSPKTVWNTFLNKIMDASLLEAIRVSVIRVLKGYALAVVLGISLGTIIGLSKHMQNITDLIIQIVKPIPPIAWIPLVILWMGIGETSKVFLIFLGGFFTILLNVIDGIRYTDKKLLEVARVMETPRKKYVTQLIIPAAFPSIFTGLRVALGICWTCVVAAELVAATSGVGYMISNARNFGQMDVVIVGMISIGIVGKIMDVILKIIEKKVLAWNI
ncbi:MAG: ABC transporter permease [Roseburia sp.]